MRLIDADKLKEELKVNGLGYQYYMLDNAPTVKAIPIEWIKRKAFENPHLSRNLFYRLIIEEWEKENETKN